MSNVIVLANVTVFTNPVILEISADNRRTKRHYRILKTSRVSPLQIIYQRMRRIQTIQRRKEFRNYSGQIAAKYKARANGSASTTWKVHLTTDTLYGSWVGGWGSRHFSGYVQWQLIANCMYWGIEDFKSKRTTPTVPLFGKISPITSSLQNNCRKSGGERKSSWSF